MTFRTRSFWAVGAAFGALAVAAPAQAACEDLMSLDVGAGRVTSATLVPAGTFAEPRGPGAPPGVGAGAYADVPAFCRVQVTLTPSGDSDIKSEIWLPARGWNGKYVGIGNGIWAGQISCSQMADPVRRGYAAASTDTGHTGSGLDAVWAEGHPEKLVDFGHRAVHVTTLATKAAARAFYGRAPALSFWNSCSTGGRQGLMAAYRYPDDFDAISAMAPANPMTDLMVQTMWQGSQAHRFGAQLTPQVLGLVHAAVIRQCDAGDGLTDGLVGNPLSCRFDVSTLQCRPGQTEGCLSNPQVSAMQNIYGGTRGPDGALLLPGWPYGSEMQLAALVAGAEPFPVATSYFRNLVYSGQAGWDWRTMDYAREVVAAREYGAEILNVPSDGLEPFFARGGKLLLSHGWGDGLIPATNSLGFHYALWNALPRAQADGQLRLFMAPGMDHCGGGEGPSDIDTLGVIDEWATTGVAPSRVLASRPTAVQSFPGQPPAAPRPAMERPLCAWPLQPVFGGVGDPNTPDGWSCSAT